MLILSDPSKIVVVGGEVDAKPRAPVEERQPIRFGPSTTPAHSELATRSLLGDGTKLFVNGKERKIGKKSQYLLDMLTLED